MTTYRIIRVADHSTDYGYSNAACRKTGVEPGKLYDDLDEAIADCGKLWSIDGTGFTPVEVDEFPVKAEE